MSWIELVLWSILRVNFYEDFEQNNGQERERKSECIPVNHFYCSKRLIQLKKFSVYSDVGILS